jgi:hypothetical protein
LGQGEATSILVVVAEPDGRLSTEQLHRLVEVLGQRPNVRIEAWFLRDYHRHRWAGARNVDALRTWPVNRALEAVGLGTVGAFLRGRRLRRWFAALDPDAVVLDDGFGARLLPAARRPPLVVVRRNPVPGHDYEFGEERRLEGDLVVSSLPAGEGDPPWLQVAPFVDELTPAQVAPRLEAAQTARARHGLPEGVPLVTGWGEDWWIDGADAFVRALWFLEHRHGVVAHGAWFGRFDDEDRSRLEAEAERCGLTGRLHLCDLGDTEDWWCGDVVVLPGRIPLEFDVALMAGACRTPIAVYAPAPVGLPWLFEVPFLDVPSLARAAADALAGRFAVPPQRWPGFVSMDRFADELLAAIAELRRR